MYEITYSILEEIIKLKQFIQLTTSIHDIPLDNFIPSLFDDGTVTLDFILQLNKGNIITFEDFDTFMKDGKSIILWLSIFNRIIFFGASQWNEVNERVLYNKLLTKLVFYNWDLHNQIIVMDYTSHNPVIEYGCASNVGKASTILADYKIHITEGPDPTSLLVFHGQNNENYTVNIIKINGLEKENIL